MTTINKKNDFSLIFYDNPIARSYVQVLIDQKIFNTNIVYMSKFSEFSLIRKRVYHKNNSYPIKFLKNKEVRSFTNEIEDFFGLRHNFLIDMYDYENLAKFKNIYFLHTESINSDITLKFISRDNSKNYLITYQEILKKILDTNKNFYHIHPGYLPLVKGADASLHSILNFNFFGASLFKMSKIIDEGDLIIRKKFFFNKHFSSNLKKNDTKNLYRLWYSFFDPALRASILKNFLKKGCIINKIINTQDEPSNYYSFMNMKDLNKCFKKIFN